VTSRAPDSVDEAVRRRAAGVRLLTLDVDGVLTDGRLYYTDSGRELKAFSVQDGQALKMLAGAGVTLAIVTGRRSHLVTRRARDLGIRHVHQAVGDKAAVLASLLDGLGLEAGDAAHMGDDLPDVPIFRRVGLALAPANHNPAIAPFVHHVTRAAGGEGAVREACELLLRARGAWEDAIAPWTRG
jgi:3-deoxy-D-manno-octulosonate 8-phosphate phosphatase (KDO 8-P phosphatase)